MVLISLGLLGFAVVDLIRWSPEAVPARRAWAALGGAVATVVGIVALSGSSLLEGVASGAATIVALGPWVAFDYAPLRGGPGRPLAWVVAVLVALLALNGSADPIGGPLESWYSGLGLGFVETVPVGQFVLGASAALFLTATVNRIVRLVLDAAVTSWERSETTLSGGRLLGPLERLIIAAIVLAADPAAAAIVITAKGLLRFPEIRGESRHPGPDAVTEYFLIGTFTSLLVAASMAVLVLATG